MSTEAGVAVRPTAAGRPPLQRAIKPAGLDQITVAHRPRLLSDNGSSYISADLATWLDGKGM